MDKVFEAVSKVSKANRLAIVFDKAAELVMIIPIPDMIILILFLEELGLGDPTIK